MSISLNKLQYLKLGAEISVEKGQYEIIDNQRG